jgi:hypothetical protein
MSKYVITITADEADPADAAHTTVRVDTSTGQTRITELTVRAANGGGLAPADLPPVDLDLLVRALTASATVPALPSHADFDTVAAGAASAAPVPVAEPVAAHAMEAPETSPTARPARSGRAAKQAGRDGRRAAQRAGRPRRAAGTRKAAAKAAKSAAAGTDRRRSAASQGGGTRPYRRMPDATEVLAAYQRIGTITGLADHYGVPRHTATAWARRLRSQGHPIGRQ